MPPSNGDQVDGSASGTPATPTAQTAGATTDCSPEDHEDVEHPACSPVEQCSYRAMEAGILGSSSTVTPAAGPTDQRPGERQQDSKLSPRVLALFERYTPEQIIDEMDRQRKELHEREEEMERRDLRARDSEQALLARMEAAEERAQALAQELAESRAQALAQELAESRALVESENEEDVEGVVKGLNDVSAAVDDLAFQISEALAGAESEVQMRSQDVDRLVQPGGLGEEYSRTLARTCLRQKKTIQDFVFLVVPTVLISILHAQILAPFKIGLSEEKDGVMRELYAQVQASEPQDRAGRWRSITYERAHHSSPSCDRVFCSRLASATFAHLAHLLSTLLPSSDSSNRTLQVSLARWEPDLCELMMKALVWRARTCRGFLSLDFVPKIVPSQEASRAAEQQKKGQKVVAITGFGLVSRKSVTVPGGKAGESEVRVVESWLEQTPVRWETDLEEEE